jgi:TusA-related sulfurtransferase
VTLHATDQMAVIDVPHFCNENGHAVLTQATQAGAAPGGKDLLIFDIVKGQTVSPD